MNEKIQIKEHAAGGTFDNPKFTITLNQSTSDEKQRTANYEALSKIIDSNDVVICLDSSLLNLQPSKREPYALNFLDAVRSLGLEYRCSKIASSSSPSFLSALFGNKNAQAQEIVAYIPNETWKTEALKNILPFYGTRYLIVKGKADSIKVMDDLQKMLDNEKLKYFDMVIYDVMSFNSISLSSDNLTLSELKARLGIA